MSSQAAKLKKRLKTIIRNMAPNKEQFVQSPGKDFTRKRKLDFTSVLSLLLSMSGGSIAAGLMDYFKFDPTAASTSAFVQQRAKLKQNAMEYLFRRFTQESPAKKTFHGYRLLAADGSDLQSFAEPDDKKRLSPPDDADKNAEGNSEIFCNPEKCRNEAAFGKTLQKSFSAKYSKTLDFWRPFAI